MKKFFAILIFLLSTGANALAQEAIYSGSRHANKIAITFDACPAKDTHFDEALFSYLIDNKITATLFLSGKWIKKNEDVVARIVQHQDLFEIGTHGHKHLRLPIHTENEILDELEKPTKILQKDFGVTPKVFRPPYGATNQTVENLAKGLGLKTIMFDVISGDPDENLSKEQLIKNVLGHTQNGSILIFHINGRGWKTAEALPEIIQSLKQKGFEFVKVSDLISDNL